MRPNVETFLGCDAPYAAADTVLYGAPFDSTASFRPGSRFGPSAMRHESFGLETYSPYQNADLTDCAVFDSGDLELCFGSPEAALRDIEARADRILEDGKLPLLLGGEHLVTLGAVWAAVRRYPDLHILHFDAHADLREEYLGTGLSHACVLRRCHELLGDGRIHQFCIRSGEREEFRFAQAHTQMQLFDFTGLEALAAQLKERGCPVYLTIDLDCLDPSALPGTGTPEAGGVSFVQLLQAVLTACTTSVVAADINELAPALDPSGVSTATACKVLRELILALHGPEGPLGKSKKESERK
ncbi:MAG: agmatinase [Oscillospiraceae bacterium]|nr:agmatinase [Oscillospiraceae bacterium]